MAQTKDELEAWYSKPDPWMFQHDPCDATRKSKIIALANKYVPYSRALDLGAGEGFITRDLPAKQIYGYELSDKAASRFPKNVSRLSKIEGKFDLIVATGVIYAQYDYLDLLKKIQQHAKNIVITCHIKDWEAKDLYDIFWGAQISYEEFPYRAYTQVLRVFKL